MLEREAGCRENDNESVTMGHPKSALAPVSRRGGVSSE
jgi:hypothetical protein